MVYYSKILSIGAQELATTKAMKGHTGLGVEVIVLNLIDKYNDFNYRGDKVGMKDNCYE